MTLGWVINDIIFSLGLTNPLINRVKFKKSKLPGWSSMRDSSADTYTGNQFLDKAEIR